MCIGYLTMRDENLKQYEVFNRLSNIAKNHKVTLSSMAVIDDVRFILEEEYNYVFTEEDFDYCYWIIIHSWQDRDYNFIINMLLDKLIDEKVLVKAEEY